jgi:monoamine oxidase
MALRPAAYSAKVCVRCAAAENLLQTMTFDRSGPLSRRRFLAGSAALAATTPAFGQSARPGGSGEVDCIIVGAGAAGIAAARKFAAARRSFILIEATNRIGGRCLTETQSFGVPFDRGAHFIYNPDSNPVAKLAPGSGLDIYPAPPGQRIRVGRRNARESELEDFLAANARSSRAIADAVRNMPDIAGVRLLPRDLGDWQPTVEFALGPYATGRDLSDLSAKELSRSVDRDNSQLCRQGYGALLAKAATGIPVQLDTVLKGVDVTNRGTKVEASTSRGPVIGRFMILTASVNVLADDRIKFDDGLPRRHLDALAKLRLGSFDHIALELPGNPLGLLRDELVFEKSSGPRTAALVANVGGTPLSVVEVAGRFGRELAAQGDKAMVEFAVEWLNGLFGPEVKKALKRTQTTQWNKEPWVLGAFAASAPGSGVDARRALMEPIRQRVFLAGEALHETAWGTVGGAWESGSRAADAVVRRIFGQPDPAVAREPEEKRPAPPPKRKSR